MKETKTLEYKAEITNSFLKTVSAFSNFCTGQIMFGVADDPVLGNVFFRLHYIEMFGTGIKRIVDAYKTCKIQPRFEIKDNSITVILPTLSTNASVSTDGNKVLESLNGEMRYSSSEIAEKLSWSKDKAVRILNVLVEAGYVKKFGTGRGTKYFKK